MKIKRALISVYDKTGIVEFAKGLHELGVEIISSSGTYRKLKEAGIPVIEVTEITNFPECLGDRVKTLNPLIQGGILAIRDNETHQEEVEKNGIPLIDMVVINLYPFQETVANPDVTQEEAIDKTDIGGPTNIRAAAKNYRDVTVIVDPTDYPFILQEMKDYSCSTTIQTRTRLAVKVWKTTSEYDTAIYNYWKNQI